MQKCYEEAAELRRQLAELASSSREAADTRVQQLESKLGDAEAGLRHVGAALSEADLLLQDCLSGQSPRGDVDGPVSSEVTESCCQIWVNPNEEAPEAVAAASDLVLDHTKQVGSQTQAKSTEIHFSPVEFP